VILENSTYFVGQYIFSSMFGPILTDFLHNYRMDLEVPSFFPGQDTWDIFTLDYRQVHKP